MGVLRGRSCLIAMTDVALGMRCLAPEVVHGGALQLSWATAHLVTLRKGMRDWRLVGQPSKRWFCSRLGAAKVDFPPLVLLIHGPGTQPRDTRVLLAVFFVSLAVCQTVGLRSIGLKVAQRTTSSFLRTDPLADVFSLKCFSRRPRFFFCACAIWSP